MSEPRERFVCDPTMLMRARLLFGMYNSRAVSPRWRRLAQAYCITVAIAVSIYASTHYNSSLYYLLNWIPSYTIFYLAFITSLWTGEEYIFKFITHDNLTDATLDSPNIFGCLMKRIKKAFIIACVFFVAYFGVQSALFSNIGISYLSLVPAILLEMFVACFCATKLLLMAVFNARFLILKRRLQRYGFRTIGRAPAQPYCQIYNEIWRKLEVTDNPLKLLLFFDLICSCCKFTSATTYYIHLLQTFDEFWLLVSVMGGLIIIKLCALSFGHVMLLESANRHCNDMAVFTVTQLIKTPTVEERRRMREFLRLLELRGARYYVLRTLPLDARLAMRAIGFCCAQVVVILITLNN